MEALARWTHPERGPVPPSDFVPVAELTGLAPELDRWVIRRALHEMADSARGRVGARRRLPRGEPVGLQPHRLVRVRRPADLTEAGPAWPIQVVLEITETAIMQNTEVAVRLLRRLRDQGFRVAMDDFGTGYSSLAYLGTSPSPR